MVNMFQKIHEQISVVGSYNSAKNAGKFNPKKFLQSDLKDGEVLQRQYAVVSAGNLYRLLFNRHDESWWLEELWYE
jgi:hypothetical protein